MSDDFPIDVIINIATRLPAKSVGRCRCISKSWHTSLSDRFFLQKHFSKSNERHVSHPEFIFTMQKLANEDRLGFFKLDCNDDISSESKFVETYNNPFEDFSCEHSLHVLGCCNGIVCLVHLYADIICLWNPCTGEYVKLPDPFHEKLSFRVGHWALTSPTGFCYNSVSNDYEIVRISHIQNGDDSTSYHVVDVYSIGANTCRRFDGLLYGSLVDFRRMGCMVSGALHWTGYNEAKISPLSGYTVIFAFNIGSRDFKQVPLPSKYAGGPPRVSSVTEFRGKLYLIILGNYSIKVWVMEDYGVAESWKKHHVFNSSKCVGRDHHKPFFLGRNGCVIAHQDVHLVLYHPEDNWDLNLLIGNNKVIFAGTYTESLLKFNADIRIGYKSKFTIPSEKQVLTYKLVKRFQAGPLVQLPQNDGPVCYSLLVEPNSVFTSQKLLPDE